MTNQQLTSLFEDDLNGRKIYFAIIHSLKELSDYEKRVIRWYLRTRRHTKLPNIVPISKNYCLDLIGYDNPKHNDVMIIKFRKALI